MADYLAVYASNLAIQCSRLRMVPDHDHKLFSIRGDNRQCFLLIPALHLKQQDATIVYRTKLKPGVPSLNTLPDLKGIKYCYDGLDVTGRFFNVRSTQSSLVFSCF